MPELCYSQIKNSAVLLISFFSKRVAYVRHENLSGPQLYFLVQCTWSKRNVNLVVYSSFHLGECELMFSIENELNMSKA